MLKLKSERSQERFRQLLSTTYFCKLNCWVLDKNISVGDCKDLHFRRLSFRKTFLWCKSKSRCFQSAWFILTQEKMSLHRRALRVHSSRLWLCWAEHQMAARLCRAPRAPEQSHMQGWDRESLQELPGDSSKILHLAPVNTPQAAPSRNLLPETYSSLTELLTSL